MFDLLIPCMRALLTAAPLTHIIKGKDLPPSPPSIRRRTSEGRIIISIIRLTLSSARPLLSSTSQSSGACSFFFFKDILFRLTEICSASAGHRRVHLRGSYTPREQRSAVTPSTGAGRQIHQPAAAATHLVYTEQPSAVWMWPRCGL